MANIREQLSRGIMYFSFQEQRKREFISYQQEMDHLKDMSADELDFVYISTKSEYEHKKKVMSVFMIAIIMSVVMGVWEGLFELILKIMQYAASYPMNSYIPLDSPENIEVVFACFIIIVALITFVLFTALIIPIRRMHKLYRQVIIIEQVKENKEEKQCARLAVI